MKRNNLNWQQMALRRCKLHLCILLGAAVTVIIRNMNVPRSIYPTRPTQTLQNCRSDHPIDQKKIQQIDLYKIIPCWNKRDLYRLFELPF